MYKDKYIIETGSPEETRELACAIAQGLSGGDFIALVGDLGAGKTMFVKGLAKGLKVEGHQYVNSPSFVILKEYAGKLPLYHFDVYRLEEESFADTIDYRAYFYGDGITVVEWADKVRDLFPEQYIEVEIQYGQGDSRRITISSYGRSMEKIGGILQGEKGDK